MHDYQPNPSNYQDKQETVLLYLAITWNFKLTLKGCVISKLNNWQYLLDFRYSQSNYFLEN